MTLLRYRVPLLAIAAALSVAAIAAPAAAVTFTEQGATLLGGANYTGRSVSLADIDKVLALEPRHFGALSGLGMIRRDKGDERGALEAFREALSINPFMSNVQDAVKALEKELEQKI